MEIYKFREDFVTEQYQWQLERSDNFYQSDWKNFVVTSGLYIENKDALIEIFQFDSFDLRLDSETTDRFRYAVYLDMRNEKVNDHLTISAEHWLQTKQRIPDLYGLFLQNNLKMKDDQTFFPEIVINLMQLVERVEEYEITGKHFALVSLNKFQLYYFFIRVPDTNSSQIKWRAYAHDYEKNSGLLEEEFGLDGEKFVITGEVEINDKTYLYIYDNEYEYSFGVEILDVMPLKLSPETKDIQESICDSEQIYKKGLKKMKDRFIIFIITLLISILTASSIFYCNRNSPFFRRGLSQQMRRGMEVDVIRLSAISSPIPDVPSKYIYSQKLGHKSKYIDMKRKQEDDIALILEIKRLARQIISEK
uniref:Uncharacterized protein LOC113789681 n=1 Tax=Dermatophagoides pteronyssinus TaxID=6956 RepID=A0A6P6XT22_DERPT|nr:uncharacterized protein LOC113789681 [Dermatophagoides pteronyssinus]